MGGGGRDGVGVFMLPEISFILRRGFNAQPQPGKKNRNSVRCLIVFCVPIEKTGINRKALQLRHNKTLFFPVKGKVIISIRLLLLSASSCPIDYHSSYFFALLLQGQEVTLNLPNRVKDSGTILADIFSLSKYILKKNTGFG